MKVATMNVSRLRIFLPALFVLSLAVGALAQDDTAPAVLRVGELRLTAPANWYIVDVPTDEPNVASIIASDEPATEQAVLLVSALPKKGRSLKTMISMNRNFIVTKMDGVVEYEKARTVNGYPAHTFVYEGRSEHSAQGRRKFMRTIIEKGNRFYVLQGVADHEPFQRHAGTLEQLVNSIGWNS
jgi:hypothetical protein